MIDDDTFDYYGGNSKTFEEWECIESMQKIFRDDVDIGELSQLSEDDKQLLEEYAPILFNTFISSDCKKRYEELKEAMYGLCESINVYRFAHTFRVGIQQHTDRELTENQGRAKRLIVFKNNALNMLKIIDDEEHEYFDNVRTDELRKILLDVTINPNDFMPTFSSRIPRTYAITKEDIRLYLRNIPIDVVDDTLSEFIFKIKIHAEK